MEENLKQLLLKDLCARLPYGVKCNVGHIIVTLEGITENGEVFADGSYFDVYDMKPYLRPMSSMTEEENKEVKKYLSSIEGQLIGFSQRVIWVNDYCLSHHIDIRHFIEKGLALEAPENMYK